MHAELLPVASDFDEVFCDEVFFDDHDVANITPREIKGDGRADNAASDDDNVRSLSHERFSAAAAHRLLTKFVFSR